MKGVCVRRVVLTVLLLVGCSRLDPSGQSGLAIFFSKPVDGQQLGLADETDPATPGYQTDIQIQVQDIQGRSVQLSGATLQTRLSSGSNWSTGANPQFNGANVSFLRTTLQPGLNILSVSVSEQGTRRTAVQNITVNVNVRAPTLHLTAPASGAVARAGECQLQLAAVAANATGEATEGRPVNISDLRMGSTQPQSIGTLTVSGGQATGSLPFANGTHTITASMIDAVGNPASDSVSNVVFSGCPALSAISPAQTNLFYVANSNFNLFLTPPTPGYIQDKIPGGDAEADFSFRVSNAIGGVARLIYRGTDLVNPQNITTDPQTFSVINAVLPQRSSGVLQFRATDSVGNQTTSSANVIVDVIPPAPSTLTTKVVRDGGERTATVDLAWTASGDDGLSGTPAGYDLRWGTNVTLPDGGIDSDTTFFNGARTRQVTLPDGGLLPATMTSYTLTPLPPLASYSIMVRARDRIGNDALYAAQPNLPNFLNQQVLSNPDVDAGTASFYGAYLSKGDFNGDGADDLVVGAAQGPGRPGSVWVYYGTPNTPPAPPFSSPPQQLTPADGALGNFGLDFSVGNVADARPDLLVSQNVWSGGRGRAFLYFGQSGGQLGNVVQFRGTLGVSGSFGGACKVISDINGDGFDEILISAHRESSNVGRVYLFYGRTLANWQALATAQDLPDTTFYVPTSSADRIFTGDGPPDSFFGRLRGYANVGNLGGDGGVSFTVPASLDTVNRVFLHSGTLVNSRAPDAGIATTDAIQPLHQACAAPLNGLFGFGHDAFGNFNIVGGPANDLIVTLPRDNRIYIFPDGSPTGFNNPPLTISSNTGNFGQSLAYGDINMDGRLDLVVGENQGLNQSLWIFYNQGRPLSEFDPTAGSGFSQSRLTGPFTLGIGVAVGDFNGDGKPDIAAGDVLDPPGKIRVSY